VVAALRKKGYTVTEEEEKTLAGEDAWIRNYTLVTRLTLLKAFETTSKELNIPVTPGAKERLAKVLSACSYTAYAQAVAAEEAEKKETDKLKLAVTRQTGEGIRQMHPLYRFEIMAQTAKRDCLVYWYAYALIEHRTKLDENAAEKFENNRAKYQSEIVKIVSDAYDDSNALVTEAPDRPAPSDETVQELPTPVEEKAEKPERERE
jgi:hypothetical protein